jgi:hypothetical protein
MRKPLLVSLSSTAATLSVVLMLGLALGIDAGGAPTASQNGDTNGDGELDVSDAVYLLLHLFRGGEPPAACPDSPELVARLAELEAALAACQADLLACRARDGLPDTGLSTCYELTTLHGGTVTFAEVPCESTACHGQDAHYSTGCSNEGRFTDNGDGTVTDDCTGLMWLRGLADTNGDGMSRWADDFTLTWCEALAYCEGLSFAGHDDWRLMNVRELLSLMSFDGATPGTLPAKF